MPLYPLLSPITIQFEIYRVSEVVNEYIQVEILIYLLCLCTGGPLNVICFGRSFRLYVRDRRQRNQILLLRLHLNIADLLTMFIYTPTQIIWMSTFQVHFARLHFCPEVLSRKGKNCPLLQMPNTPVFRVVQAC